MTGILPDTNDAPNDYPSVTLTFPDTFAMRDAIIEAIRALSPEERVETIADMQFFATFAPEGPDTIKALTGFWRTLRDLFELEAAHPSAARDAIAWRQMRHMERRAAVHLMSAGIRGLHLPGCATFTTIH